MLIQAFIDGFLEKIANTAFTSYLSSERHSKKHAKNLGLTDQEYYRLARDVIENKKNWSPITAKRGAPTYRHKYKGYTAVLTPDETKVITLY